MSEQQDFIDASLAYTRHQFQMTPEKFGYIGGYCSSTLKAEPAEYQAQMIGQQMTKFVMNVMSGRTVSEHPEVSITFQSPRTWQDHAKRSLRDWRDKQNARWEGTGYDGQPDTPPPWMILLWPFLVLFPKWLDRHPVKLRSETRKTTVNFRQSVLYPEMDHIPPEFGRAVIYESFDLSPACFPGGQSFGINSGPSRFMDRHEVMSAFMRDPDASRYESYSLGSTAYPVAFMGWLERNGVNVDQLVKRR